MPKKPAFEWTSLTGDEKEAAFSSADVATLTKSQLVAMLEWSNMAGSERYLRMSKVALRAAFVIMQRNMAAPTDPQSPLDMDELLCVLLQKYCAAAELPYMDAESLINSDRLTAAQRLWLGSFVDMWDATIALIEARDAKVKS